MTTSFFFLLVTSQSLGLHNRSCLPSFLLVPFVPFVPSLLCALCVSVFRYSFFSLRLCVSSAFLRYPLFFRRRLHRSIESVKLVGARHAVPVFHT